MQPIWKDVPGYPGYLVSSDGKIASMRSGERRMLSQRMHKGYWHVQVKRDGHQKKRPVHQLVLLAFVGPKTEQKPEGRHLNGDALDNRCSNLAWGSRMDNHRDALEHGTATCLKRGEKHPVAKLSDQQVIEIRAAHQSGTTQAALATTYQVSQHHISDLVRCRSRAA